MAEHIELAIQGAQGLVTEAILDLLCDRGYPQHLLRVLDRDSQLGRTLDYGGHALGVDPIAGQDFSRIRCLIVDPVVDDEETLNRALAAGCSVIAGGRHADIAGVAPIGHPIALAIARIRPLLAAVAPTHLRVTALSGVAAGGAAMVEELALQTRQLLTFNPIEPRLLPAQIAFNVVPDVDDDAQRACAEQLAGLSELASTDIDLSLFWVPMMFGQLLSIQMIAASDCELNALAESITGQAGVEVHPHAQLLTPVGDASGSDTLQLGALGYAGRGKSAVKLQLMYDNIRQQAGEALRLWTSMHAQSVTF